MTDTVLPTESLIAGMMLFELRQIADERGAVLHVMRSDAPDFTRFGECYCSEVLPGVVKAWKRHGVQTQNLAVPVGRIRMAIYDDRSGSPTRGRIQTFDVGRPDAYLRVRIPPGVWYGFACVSEMPALIVNCADFPHDPSESEQRRMDDPGIPYTWTQHLPETR